MGIYSDVHGEIKIEPELSTDEINYFRSRFYHHILSLAWKNWANTEGEALKMAMDEAKKYIKMERIAVNPYRGICKDHLEFIAKMLGSRASGQLKICSSTTYGDPNVNGGWTNDVTTIEFKDGKVTIDHPSSEIKKEETRLPSVLTIGGNVVQTGKTRDDLTLLEYNKELRSLGFYHSWKVDGEELKDGDEILNLADNSSAISIPYHDGTTNNFLFVKGGLVTTLNPVSRTVIGNSGTHMTTEQENRQKDLDDLYGTGNYKIVNLPYLKGVVKY